MARTISRNWLSRGGFERAEREGHRLWLSRRHAGDEEQRERALWVMCAAPAERTFAFEDDFNGDRQRWLAGLDAESREAARAIGLDVNW